MNKNFRNDFNSEIDGVINSIEKVMNAVPQGKTKKAQAAHEKVEFIASQATATLRCITNDYIVIDTLGLIDKLKTDVIIQAGYLNDHADKGDSNRNRVNYGTIINAMKILSMLGIEVDMHEWEDKNGYLRVAQVEIDGKVQKYHNGV